MKLERLLIGSGKKIPFRVDSTFSSAVHWFGGKHEPVHRWFKYREGFAPSLLRKLHIKGGVLDPFCGCGTTLLECSRQNVNSKGIDLNPLATFVARVKTRRYTKRDRQEFVRWSRASSDLVRSSTGYPAPKFPLRDKFFQPQALRQLLIIRNAIESLGNQKVKDLAFLGWLAVLEPCSNVFKEGNGIKYRNKKRMPGKYITLSDSKWIPDYFGESINEFVWNKWKQKCDEIAEDLEIVVRTDSVEPEIQTGSSLDLDILKRGGKIQHVVFSPPYANRFDYFEAFKMELWMGEFVRSRDDLARLRKAAMRNNFAANRTGASPKWAPLEPFLDAMDPGASSVRMGIKDTMRAYFDDTRSLLRNLKKVLPAGGTISIVVGNSSYAGSIIPTDSLLARVALEEQLKVKEVIVARELHVSSQQRQKLAPLRRFMRESVVLLQK